MAESLFSEDEVLYLADQLRDFDSSPIKNALEFIGGRLLQQNMEQNLTETERCRNWFRGYRTGIGAELTGAGAILTQADKILARDSGTPPDRK